MATTDNIGHTPCRTTTPPFGHFLSPMPERKVDEVKKKNKNKSHGREADGGSIEEGFPRNHPSTPSSSYSKSPSHLRTLWFSHRVSYRLSFLSFLSNFLRAFPVLFRFASPASDLRAIGRTPILTYLRFIRLSHHLRASHARTSL